MQPIKTCPSGTYIIYTKVSGCKICEFDRFGVLCTSTYKEPIGCLLILRCRVRNYQERGGHQLISGII